MQSGKLVVVGAGAVGSSIAYAALIRSSARDIVLYDVDGPKVDAQVLDLAHGTQFTGVGSVSGGNDIAVAGGADVVVITAGAKQKPGQSRLDLAGTNAEILRTVLPPLLAVSPDAVYLLVTNPCDVMTVIAQRILGLPSGRVFGSGTLLDTSRLRWLIAQKAGISRSSVHASIVGEHGDTEFPLWTGASIGGVPLKDWELPDGEKPFSPQVLDELTREVANAAYRVIAGKGATNYAIGLSAARIIEAVLRGEDAVLPVSSVLDGPYGMSGVALSLPSVVGTGGVRSVLNVPMDDGERERLARSAAAIQAALDALMLPERGS
ncbi:L-lactate dehydrogenase [Sinomonas sp. JGH33]|uniref:L-lactate dehydrogenase n=1 Tax=Sinomonas terricola TaxID=3110330 RepID=A0ABU5T772_9MICC|nr:L-lactate dehydrogenase [Sinomonas sp. JGH33]MEA5455438.1 L-lactate dehydrogenase [Sinomonas sp. JGH33]